MNHLLRLACVLLLLLPLPPAAAATHEVPVMSIVDGGRVLPEAALQLDTPDGWVVATRTEIGMTALELSPPSGRGFLLQLSAFSIPAERAELLQADSLRRQLAVSAARVQPQAVEAELRIEALAGALARGHYFSATDRAPGADGYRYMTSGLFAVGDRLVNVTLLINDEAEGGAEALRAQALAAIAALRPAR